MSPEAANELQIPREIAQPAADWILRTKTHDPGASTACACFLDCDLAILGAPANLYRTYSEAIRNEYAWVPDEAYRSGRRQVLTAFLNRKAIYATPLMVNELEDAARRNLGDELRELNCLTLPLRAR
jgi:predicted metal-dependent HD superfamily phosphohydrolase